MSLRPVWKVSLSLYVARSQLSKLSVHGSSTPIGVGKITACYMLAYMIRLSVVTVLGLVWSVPLIKNLERYVSMVGLKLEDTVTVRRFAHSLNYNFQAHSSTSLNGSSDGADDTMGEVSDITVGPQAPYRLTAVQASPATASLASSVCSPLSTSQAPSLHPPSPRHPTSSPISPVRPLPGSLSHLKPNLPPSSTPSTTFPNSALASCAAHGRTSSMHPGSPGGAGKPTRVHLESSNGRIG
jgi:hypothetical protein